MCVHDVALCLINDRVGDIDATSEKGRSAIPLTRGKAVTLLIFSRRLPLGLSLLLSTYPTLVPLFYCVSTEACSSVAWRTPAYCAVPADVHT